MSTPQQFPWTSVLDPIDLSSLGIPPTDEAHRVTDKFNMLAANVFNPVTLIEPKNPLLPEQAITNNMVEPPTDIHMSSTNVTSSNGKGADKCKPPKDFDGDKAKFKTWLRMVEAYLRANRNMFPNNTERINYILSTMNIGKATRWAEHFLDTHTNDQREFTLNQTLLQFYQLLEKSFDIRRTQERAQTDLAVLKQKTGDLENYIIDFNVLTSKAGFILSGSTENPMLPPAFLKGLSPTLRRKIIEQKEPPKTLKGIIDNARKYEQSYYQSLQWKDKITRWPLTRSLPHSPIHPAYTSKPQDPDTMDIDRLSIDK